MPRYAFRIEYDGHPFKGWQRQTDLPSVQGAVEAALAKLEADVPTIAAAGRTDTGVHALGQVAHADMQRDWDPFRLAEALNYHLKPAPVAITACARAHDDFHARFSATWRSYTYRMICRRAPLVHARGHAWAVRGTLDVTAMAEGARHLIGKHDFTTFRATHCQALSPIKTMDEIRVEEVSLPAGTEIRFHLKAQSFLHNQVRSIVGSLEHVGSGAWAPDDMRRALEACDRAECGTVAPPDGLYMTGVGYDEDPFADGWKDT
ncbi:tRNA pseudouridine(38-40) synthase TruA [Jannaschia sp. CCS1]|uniref:tRNA pseudouridine synthase A n=1 Tax=Jannaschia sp. (strain CCS1) TaxID=290400 RepID=TRUA_JANSC|nr:tRNA pseudouridine(38-40) synthase TruA [Jannaschia sp. CCS1]Q28LN3.1 RecName: Full=tRNA pseudouridine synthase A; AltName: Full=tRNA pseudouridine(38-40) synthase; AltName: Full=tRNA pseudouridylate synthase I; AltName: Full=tRNA-uridine isomerase I [Jannaschia sp. CCS1]ABD56379.1 tRNA pseudouridine synthase A [Jannaschia sp. CCS1]